MKPARKIVRKAVVTFTAACLAATSSTAVHASIASEMRDMYQSLSGLPGELAEVPGDLLDSTQINQPGAFHGQTYHTYMGGSVMQRMPIRTLQPVSIDMPRFSAGCGGVDMYFGSISHLNGDKIVQFLKAVAMNMGGVITQVALKAITPLLGSTLEWAKGVADWINGKNLDSCSMAKGLVAGGMNAVTMSDNADCIEMRMVNNGENIEEAREKCQSAGGMSGTLNSPAAVKQASFKGNLTWEALKKTVPDLDPQERQLIMSLLGSYVFHKDDASPDIAPRDGAASTAPGAETGGSDANHHTKRTDVSSSGDVSPAASVKVTPRPLPPTITDIADFMMGNGGSAVSPDEVSVKLYVCDEVEACLNPRQDDVTIPSLSARVKTDLMQIAASIENREGLTQNQVALINKTTVPVWKMLSLGTMVRGGNMAEQMIDQYKDVIATDYAYVVLGRAVKNGLAALRTNFNFNSYQEELIRSMQGEGNQKLERLRQQHVDAQKKVADLGGTTVFLQSLERQLRSQMPQQVVDMLAQSGVRGTR